MRTTPRVMSRPRLVLLVATALLVAGLVADLFVPAAPQAETIVQGAAPAGVWYCTAAAGEGQAALLDVAAVGDAPAHVVVVRYGDQGPVPDAPVAVSPGDVLTVALDPPQGTWPLAVHWSGGPVAATWRVTAGGVGAAPCEPVPSATWYVTGFDTTLGNSSWLQLFNPHRIDATARLVFATPQGEVALVTTDNVVVPAGQVLRLNLADVQPELPDLGVRVDVLAGRLVVSGDLRLDTQQARGRTLVRAADAPARTWAFAYARADDRSSSWLSVLNPTGRDAAIEVRVSDPNTAEAALLEEVTVPAGAVGRIELQGASSAEEFGVQVAVVNDVPVVVSRYTAIRTPSGRSGVAASLGATSLARTWAAVGGGGQERAARLSLYNPGSDVVAVRVAAGPESPGEWQAISLGANARTVVELTAAGKDRPTIPALVTADDPIVVELRSQSFAQGLQLWTAVGVPERAWSGPPTRPPLRHDPDLARDADLLTQSER